MIVQAESMNRLGMINARNGRISGRSGLALAVGVFCVWCSVQLQAVASDKALDFQQFAIDQREKPFDLACAQKHGKYLSEAVFAGNEQLASIRSDSGTKVGYKQTQKRSTYSSKVVQYTAPEVELLTDDSQAVNFADYLATGKPVMLNFIFTTCTTICPVLSASFKNVQDLMGDEADEVLMISISIDPEYDTPEKLRQYSERFSAGGQWKFLTGRISDIITVEKAFDIYRGSKTNHEPVTFIRAGTADSWLRIEGFANAAEIVAEYEQLINAGES